LAFAQSCGDVLSDYRINLGNWGARSLRTSRAVVAGLVLSLASVSLAGCAHGTKSHASALRADTALLRVRDGYNAYWDAFLKASDPPNPKAPSLAAHAIAPELDSVRRSLTARQQMKQGLRGAYVHDDTIDMTSATQATVRDCLTLKGEVVDLKTGSIMARIPDVTSPVSVDMRLVSGVWKVSRVAQGSQTCRRPTPPVSVSPPMPSSATPSKGQS